MGAWGTGLYSNDTASDIRFVYVDHLRRGKTNEEAVKLLLEKNEDWLDDVEEAPLFWYALADTQWNYGRLLPEVKEKALYYLSQDDELERWREAGEDKLKKWLNTLENLKAKLLTEQPPEKKVSKYRLYKCTWNVGDIFAYRFTSDYSKEKGFFGKYAYFKKVSETDWWPGHIVPIVQMFKVISDEVLSVDEILKYEILPANMTRLGLKNFPHHKIGYNVGIIKESERAIPKENLIFLGNDDRAKPSPEEKFYSDQYVGWESSKYNTKIEHHIIFMCTEWL